MYPACEGDAFLISLGENQDINIIIDMGLSDTYTSFIRNDLIELKKQGRKIDLMVITHVDQDHIQGAISFVEENGIEQNIIEVSEVWHNSYRHLQFDKEKKQITNDERLSLEQIKLQNQYIKNDGESDATVEQGTTLAALLYANKYNWNTSFMNKAVCIENNFSTSLPNLNIKLLSPNQDKLKRLSKYWLKYLEAISYNFNISEDNIFDDAYELCLQQDKDVEVITTDASNSKQKFNIEKLSEMKGKDSSRTNGSSISFIINYNGKKLLFLGDAHNDNILNELNALKDSGYKLDFEVVKVPHHGSKNNISKEFLELIKSKRYLISTSGARHNHPDLEAVAKIATAGHRKIIFTNYIHKKLSDFNDSKLEEKYNYKIQCCNNFTIE